MTNLQTIDIKGKAYVPVNERLKEFRTNPEYKGWSLTSEIISLKDWVVVIKATIRDNEWREIANWLSYEKENSTFINKTSYIENSETSAWGRALGNLWIWIDTSVASVEEIINAITSQNVSQQVEKVFNEPKLDPLPDENWWHKCKVCNWGIKIINGTSKTWTAYKKAQCLNSNCKDWKYISSYFIND